MDTVRYHVVATSFPIVYTAEGDHDPAGLLYTLATSAPLLDWARRQWARDDEWLPRAHERAQRIALLVDALERYELMAGVLTGTADEDLLGYTGPAGGIVAAEPPEAPDDLGDAPARRERRQHLRETVDEIVGLLRVLTGRAVRTLPAAAARADLRARWGATLPGLEETIAQRLDLVAKAWERDRDVLVGRVADAMADRALARAVRRRGSPERARLEARMDRLVLNDSPQEVDGTYRYTRFHPVKPFTLVRPLVLRARRGERVEVTLRNSVRGRRVGFHLQGSGPIGGVRKDDGAAVGRNPDTTVAYRGTRVFRWDTPHEGVWPVHDLADVRGSERGTNVHGLFAVLTVLPEHTHWHDPETGERLDGTDFADGLDVDAVCTRPTAPAGEWVDFHHSGLPAGWREFTVVIHDEPEVTGALHRAADAEPPVMPISYRGEPLHNRLPHRMRALARRWADADPPETGVDLHQVQRRVVGTLAEEFWIGRRADGTWVERVAGEEQHHSSWLFGDPVTPVLRAYAGDPARVRLLHAGVKETHVFHLHVHQWRAVPTDTAEPGAAAGSQLVDSISIGPQHGFTVDPLYGSGSRQHAPGDVIWHCHLYPHFHHGMWGLWRSFDRAVPEARPYPDASVCHPLRPLPGREQADDRAGFPWFIDAEYPQKAPPPPARTDAERGGRRRLLGLPAAGAAEFAAMVPPARRRPGALFVDLDGAAAAWNAAAELPAPRVVHVEVEVRSDPMVHNDRGWHDPSGHRYRVTGLRVDGGPDEPLPPDPARPEPLFVRAHQGDVVELTLTNRLGSFPADHFDLAQLPVECGLHVHLVKFDVLAADGSSTGWNYLSGASCRDAVPGVPDTPMSAITGFHRWVVDEEFGPCFFHDHLLANHRQKRGLYAALIAEPPGSRFLDPLTAAPAWTGTQAVVVPPATPPARRFAAFREACLAIGDFVPSFERGGDPLNPPGLLSGDDDPGIMTVNHRCAPLTFRGDEPARWFAGRDPDTGVIRTHPGDRLRIRLVQGSHEEQHSFVTHALAWRRDWHRADSPLVNQQTLGISEAFTLDVGGPDGLPYGLGDHLWRLSAIDDLWLGCWGIVRSEPPGRGLPALPGAVAPEPLDRERTGTGVRHFTVRARRVEHRYDGDALTDPWGLVYEAVPDGSLVDAFAAGTRAGEWRLSTAEPAADPEPLVLRCRAGEWVHVTLVNEVLLAADRDPDTAGATEGWAGRHADATLPPFVAEPDPPRLPLDDVRRVSSRVSLHPALLRRDVVADDGSYVGHNHDGTVSALPVRLTGDHEVPHPAAGVLTGESTGEATGGVDGDPDGDPLVVHRTDRTNVRHHWWYADPALLTGSPAGRVCLLHDMADVRNHRHHGLVGAVVIEPAGVELGADASTRPGATLARAEGPDGPAGPGGAHVHERVLFVHDGLRLFLSGNPAQPVPDVEPDVDPEDSGQRGLNYRSALLRSRRMLRDDAPPTPVWGSPRGETVWLRLVGAGDKPRNHTLTVHGADLLPAPWLADGPREGALSGFGPGSTHDVVLVPGHPGDHAVRSGAFRWSVEQGVWALLRIT